MEMTMKTAKLFFKTTCLFTAAILTGCTADVAQEEEKNKEPNPAATNITFTSENPSTRTSITHSIGDGARPFWSVGDRIWVKDVNGKWQKVAKEHSAKICLMVYSRFHRVHSVTIVKLITLVLMEQKATW